MGWDEELWRDGRLVADPVLDRLERGLLVDAGRADEDVLPRRACEELDVALDVVGAEGDPIHHGVPLVSGDGLGNLGRLGDVAPDDLGARNADLPRAAIEQVQVHVLRHGQLARRRTDDARAADKQHLHAFSLLDCREDTTGRQCPSSCGHLSPRYSARYRLPSICFLRSM